MIIAGMELGPFSTGMELKWMQMKWKYDGNGMVVE